MNTLYKTCLVLSTIGCLNWGLVGLFNFNLVEYLFGDGALLTRIIYVLTCYFFIDNFFILGYHNYRDDCSEKSSIIDIIFIIRNYYLF